MVYMEIQRRDANGQLNGSDVALGIDTSPGEKVKKNSDSFCLLRGGTEERNGNRG